MSNSALQKMDELQVAVQPTPGELMQGMIKSGVTPENVAAFTELIKLSEHMEDRTAKKGFAKAFNDLQSEMHTVKATKIIPDRNGGMRSSFAPYEEIDSQVRPLCLKHGFTYSFSEGPFQAGKVTKVITLQHADGHERSNSFSVRIGNGPPGCSESQADGSAHSYAKRGALCDCLNIVVTGIDNDARNEGGVITQEQAEELAHRVAMTNSNKVAFLKLAGVDSFAEISTAKYEVLDQFLAMKERKQ